MRKSKRWGLPLMIVGLGMLLAAGCWAWYNANAEQEAELSVQTAVSEIVEALPPVTDDWQNAVLAPGIPIREEPAQETEQTIEVEGETYIGVLSIPALSLELPIRSDWSYPALKKTPCRYVGTAKGGDLVIMAHNYKSHFGYLDQLPEGSQVVFTTAGGDVLTYEVAYVEVLQPTAIQDMTAGEFPLTLFTCTYGGRSRVTVRCDWAQ